MPTSEAVKPFQRIKLYPTSGNYGQQIIETNVSTNGERTLKKDRTLNSPSVDFVNSVEGWAKKVEEANSPKAKAPYIDGIRQHVELKVNIIVPGLAVMPVEEYIKTDHFKSMKAAQWFGRLDRIHIEYAAKLGGDIGRMQTDYDYLKEVMGKVADFRDKAEKPCAFCGVKKEPKTACANQDCQSHNFPVVYADNSVHIFLPGTEHVNVGWGGAVKIDLRRGDYSSEDRDAYTRVVGTEFRTNSLGSRSTVEEARHFAKAITLGAYLAESVLSRYVGKNIDQDVDLQFDFA